MRWSQKPRVDLYMPCGAMALTHKYNLNLKEERVKGRKFILGIIDRLVTSSGDLLK